MKEIDDQILKQLSIIVEKVKEAFTYDKKWELLPMCPLPNLESAKRSFLQSALYFLEQKHLLPVKNWEVLESIEEFYAPIGGILGYQLEFYKQKYSTKEQLELEKPMGVDFSYPSLEKKCAIRAGLETLPMLGELYVLGGLASRLQLKDPQGNALPAALFPFRGKPLLEWLILDLVGREVLYEKIFGSKIVVPVAMMTSQLNWHDPKVRSLCEDLWKKYSRPLETLFLFSQIGVPVLDEEGTWMIEKEGDLLLQPGGHGAIWQSAIQNGVFDWFANQGVEHLLIRQINNPVVGVNEQLLAFVGHGVCTKAMFGFASCSRPAKAEEGMLALVKRAEGFSLSNIEYTDFTKFGLLDESNEDGSSSFPANTNLLYAHLSSLREQVERVPFVGMTLNMKQERGEKKIGRLESMMQSASDLFTSTTKSTLPVFMTYDLRRYTLSPAKRAFVEGGTLLGTPERAFYDWAHTAHDLLQLCDIQTPHFPDEESYMIGGLPYHFDYAPYLGPLFKIIAQKMKGGKIRWGSALFLDLTELCMVDIDLEGTLQITSAHLHGQCLLQNVKILNQGSYLKSPYWIWDWHTFESCQIFLEGESAFEAKDVLIEGNQIFCVPHGEKWILSDSGIEKEPFCPRPIWAYTLKDGDVDLVAQGVQKILN